MPGTLLAAICSPLPEPPMTTPSVPGRRRRERRWRCRTAGSRRRVVGAAPTSRRRGPRPDATRGPSARSRHGRTRGGRARRKILPCRSRGWMGCPAVGRRRRSAGGVGWTVVPDAAAVVAATRGARPSGSTSRSDCPRAAPAGPATRSPRTGWAGPARRCSRRRRGRCWPRRTTAGRARWRARSPDGRSACRRSTSPEDRASWDAVATARRRSSRCIPNCRSARWRPRWTSGRRSRRAAPGSGSRPSPAGLDPAAALGDLPAGARLDDVLDALAVAWSAARWARGGRGARRRVRRRGRPCGSSCSGCRDPAGRRGSSQVGPALLAPLRGLGAAAQHPAAGRPADRRGRRPAPRPTWPRRVAWRCRPSRSGRGSAGASGSAWRRRRPRRRAAARPGPAGRRTHG